MPKWLQKFQIEQRCISSVSESSRYDEFAKFLISPPFHTSNEVTVARAAAVPLLAPFVISVPLSVWPLAVRTMNHGYCSVPLAPANFTNSSTPMSDL